MTLAFTPADFYLVLIFGFVSSLHCVQMCGPVVLTYSVAANTASGRRSLLGLHLAYNAGRTLTYMLLGAVAGLAGGAMGWVGSLAGIENVASIVAGVAMVVTAFVMLGLGLGLKGWGGFAMPARLLRPAGKLISSPSPQSKFALGLLIGFLPCGLIYAALMKAIGTATPVGGVLTMLAFGMGTSVALVVVGLGSSAATRKIARWGTTISAITVLVMGAILIARGALAGPYLMHCHMGHMAI
ncbi:MAG: sulfite exporter TauE/SafE family protein [Terracidiphilus sp.]